MHLSQDANGFPKLIVAEVRRGTQAQEIAAEVGEHTAGPQPLKEVVCTIGANGEESRTTIVGHRLDARHRRIDIERFESVLQESNLVAADLAQPLGRQPLLGVEGEYRGGTIV